jgi:hypothetical protein
VEAGRVRADRMGVPSTGGERCLSRARNSRKAVPDAFLRCGDQNAGYAKPGPTWNARGGCGAPACQGGTSAGGAVEPDLAVTLSLQRSQGSLGDSAQPTSCLVRSSVQG